MKMVDVDGDGGGDGDGDAAANDDDFDGWWLVVKMMVIVKVMIDAGGDGWW